MWAKLRKSLSGVGSTTEDPPNDSACVRVAVRVRPLVPIEKQDQAQSCISADEKENCIWVGSVRQFTFDHVFGPSCCQEDVYRMCAAELVEAAFLGMNCTVFAFGQTSSGKTFTMGSSPLASPGDCGIIPRVLREMYRRKAHMDAASSCSIRIQYLEIYNEEIKDLLQPDIPSKRIALRETSDGKILVAGATDQEADSEEQALRLLELGSLSRSTGTTNMNEHSSRSHAIFTLLLEQRIVGSSDGGENADPNVGSSVRFLTAKFHLVDLAGSERAKKTGAAGLRLKESVTINSGLLALGNVISALSTETKRRSAHIPYRTSKLTRLLQDSLGGNSKTVMLACVTCADTHLEESLNTLKYAQRARYIKNKPLVNQEARPVSAPDKAMPGPVEDDTGGLTTIGELDEGGAGARSHAERGGSAVLRPHLSLFSANQQNRWLRSQLSRLQEGLGTACKIERAFSESIAELHSRGELSTSGRGRLLSILSSLQALSDATPEATGDNGGDALPRRAASLPSGIRSLLAVRASQASRREAHTRSDTAVLQTRIRQLEREISERNEEAAKYRRLLQEAQEDLAQDEVIFAAKMKELKLAKEQIALLKERCDSASTSHVCESIQSAARADGGDAAKLECKVPDQRGGDCSGLGVTVTHNGQAADGLHPEPSASDLCPQDSDLVLLGDRDPSPDPRADGNVDEAALRAARASLDLQLREMVANIQQKEELISQLRKNEATAQLLSQQYLDRVKEMEGEANGKEAVIKELQEKLASVETNRRHSLEEKRQLRSQFQAKIAAVTSQLGSLQKQLKERTANQVVERERERSHVRARQLEEEVTSMRRQQDALQSRLRDVNQRFEKAAAGWAREALDLRKKCNAARQQARTLQLDLQTARLALQRKQQELDSLQERLEGGNTKGGAQAEASSSRMRSRTSFTGRRSTAPELGANVPSQGPIDQAWLEATLQKVVQHAEADSTVEELAKKEAALLAEKAQAEDELQERSMDPGDVTAGDAEGEDSRMEALQLKLDVVRERLTEARKVAAARKSAQQELANVASGGHPGQVQAALVICLRELGKRCTQHRQSAAQVATLEAALAERERLLTAISHRLQLKEVDFERRMTQAAQHQEASVGSLLQELARSKASSCSSHCHTPDEETRSSRDSSPGSPSETSSTGTPAPEGNAPATSHFTIPAHRTSGTGSAQGRGSATVSAVHVRDDDPIAAGLSGTACILREHRRCGRQASSRKDGAVKGATKAKSGKRASSDGRECQARSGVQDACQQRLVKENLAYADEDAAWLHYRVT